MRKKTVLSILTTFLMLLIGSSSGFSAPPSYRTPFYDGFESGNKNGYWDSELPSASSGKAVKTRASTGSYSFRMELNKSDPVVAGNKRAEISLNTEKPLEEHWYGVSIYLPADADEYYSDDENSPESLLQWHNYPDIGEDWTSPPLSLITQNGNYYISRCWDDAPITSDDQIDKKGYTGLYDLGSYHKDMGKWVRWVFHIKWGWSADQDPITEVYKNGIKVLELNGLPNTTNDKKGVYLKVGIYKWDWNLASSLSTLARRVVYYDNIAIDNGNDIKMCSASRNTTVINSGNILSGSSAFLDSFESGKISLRWISELPYKSIDAVDDTYASSGSYSFRSALDRNAPDIAGKNRAQITLHNEKPLEEHWYGINILLPSSPEEYYKTDKSGSESLIQWHNYPDTGEDWTSPPLEFGIENCSYYLSRSWDDAPITSNDQMKKKGNVASNSLGSYQEDVGQWVRWVFHVKWGWSEAQKPLLEVYKNGKKLLDLKGSPNMTNDRKGIYWKIGIYKAGWTYNSSDLSILKRVVYYDDVGLDQADDIKLGFN